MKPSLLLRYLQMGFYRIVLNRSHLKQFNNHVLEFIDYTHATPESGRAYHKHYLFKLALENLPSDNPILEIGVYAGRSTNSLNHIKNLLELSNPIVTTDPFLFGDSAQQLTSGIDMASIETFIKQKFIENIRFWQSDKLPASFDLTSDNFFELWKQEKVKETLFGDNFQMGGKFSFCHIDGNHFYDYVKRDFENVDRFLEVNGLVLFDDSDPYHRDYNRETNDVYVVVKEALKTGRYRIVDKNPNFLLEKISERN